MHDPRKLMYKMVRWLYYPFYEFTIVVPVFMGVISIYILILMFTIFIPNSLYSIRGFHARTDLPENGGICGGYADFNYEVSLLQRKLGMSLC